MIALSRTNGGLFPLLACAFVVGGVLFWPGVQVILAAWATPEYSHGPLIPLISAWLFLREMQTRPEPAKPGGAGLGIAVLLLAFLLGMVGQIASIGDVSAYGLLLWIFALVLLAMGARRGLGHWASVAHLVFMLPLPQVIWWQANLFLQGISAELGVALISLFGIPVFLEGHIIDLGVWRLEVAEACSGLRYLFPILSFSVLMAVVYNGPTWAKTVILLSAAPIAVLLNALRVGVIGVLVNAYGIEMAQGALHVMQGWVIFGGCLALLWLLARLLWGRRDGPMLDVQGVDLPSAARSAKTAQPRDAALFAVGVTAVFALALALWPSAERTVPQRQPLGALPSSVPWPSQSSVLAPEIEAVLDADDYLDTAFVLPQDDAPVNLFVAWYRDQTSGRGLHSPEICLPAGGWEIAKLETQTIRPDGVRAFEVNRAIITREGQRRLVYYWFDQRGDTMTSAIAAKLDVLVDSLFSGRSDGALVRVMTPIAADETVDAADARLLRTVSGVLPVLPDHVPG